MFTGLTERQGHLDSLAPSAGGALVRIECGSMAGELALGESVAVDGICLTVVRTGPVWFEVEAAPETLARTALGDKLRGSAVNLERALRLSDRLGGHLVQGHVDGVGTLTEVFPEGDGKRIRVRAPAVLQRYLAEKGSVALDGVSLTIAALHRPDFEVALIPHTLRHTTLGEWRAPRRINIEVDLVARYLESLLQPWSDQRSVPREG